jgi:hypothetical protein
MCVGAILFKGMEKANNIVLIHCPLARRALFFGSKDRAKILFSEEKIIQVPKKTSFLGSNF